MLSCILSNLFTYLVLVLELSIPFTFNLIAPNHKVFLPSYSQPASTLKGMHLVNEKLQPKFFLTSNCSLEIEMQAIHFRTLLLQIMVVDPSVAREARGLWRKNRFGYVKNSRHVKQMYDTHTKMWCWQKTKKYDSKARKTTPKFFRNSAKTWERHEKTLPVDPGSTHVWKRRYVLHVCTLWLCVCVIVYLRTYVSVLVKYLV